MDQFPSRAWDVLLFRRKEPQSRVAAAETFARLTNVGRIALPTLLFLLRQCLQGIRQLV